MTAGEQKFQSRQSLAGKADSGSPGQNAPAVSARTPKLMDQLNEALRSRHYSRRTEQAYCHWFRRFIFFHNVRHPAEMAEPESNAFLTHPAVKEKISTSTQNQALSALLFPPFIPLRLTCLKAAAIFERSRSCWAITTSRRR
jgi:hypothetical protein